MKDKQEGEKREDQKGEEKKEDERKEEAKDEEQEDRSGEEKREEGEGKKEDQTQDSQFPQDQEQSPFPHQPHSAGAVPPRRRRRTLISRRRRERPSSSAQNGQYGLLGLLDWIRMRTNSDLNTLAMGLDLTTLGLNLNSPVRLHQNFYSPFLDKPIRPDLGDFKIPSCYYVKMPPAPSKLSSVADATLMYIFYNMPRDVLQICAANELFVFCFCFLFFVFCFFFSFSFIIPFFLSFFPLIIPFP